MSPTLNGTLPSSMALLVCEHYFLDHLCNRVPEYFVGFQGTFSADVLKVLRAHRDVESISEDGIMSIYTTQ